MVDELPDSAVASDAGWNIDTTRHDALPFAWRAAGVRGSGAGVGGPGRGVGSGDCLAGHPASHGILPRFGVMVMHVNKIPRIIH